MGYRSLLGRKSGSVREVEFTIYNKVSAMDWLLAVSYSLLAIGTIGAIRVIGSLTSNF